MLRRFLLLALWTVAVPCAAAQVVVAPSAVEATVPQGQTAELPLTLTNTTAEPLRLALALAPVLPDDGTEPGDVLFASPRLPGLTALAAHPDGRLFASVGTLNFAEFTSELALVREFGHPAFHPLTVGLTYNADARSPLSAEPGEGTLWWLNVDVDEGDVAEAELFEGTLGDPTADPSDDAWDSQFTGRELPVFFSPKPGCGDPAGRPAMLAYDAVSTPGLTGGTGRYYWLDLQHDVVWAMDTLGAVVEGYPVAFTDYKRAPWGDPEGEVDPAVCFVGFGLDAHALSSVEGLGGERVFEVMIGFQDELPFNRASRAVVVDRRGRNRGAETPLAELPVPEGGTEIFELADVARSRVDPGVLYIVVRAGPVGPEARVVVYGVRAAPLPPRWLHASRVLWELAPGGTEGGEVEAVLRLEAEGLGVGTYEGVVSVRAGDGIGPVIAEVPVVLTVTEGTGAEEDAEPESEARWSVYPNPASGSATVALTLSVAETVRVTVVDVLGREVAVLHDGPLAAGTHALRFEGEGLPSGLYIVRVTSGRSTTAQRVTLLR